MSEEPDESDAGAKPQAVRVTAAKCVRCAAPVQPRYRPFCSQRCADIDLGSWLRGSYRVATEEAPDGAAEGEAGPDKA